MPEHEFLVMDYFRKHNVPIDMFLSNFYDLALLKKYEIHYGMELSEDMYRLCEEEYLKFRDMTADLTRYVKFTRLIWKIVKELNLSA
jgi:hypothetical protein